MPQPIRYFTLDVEADGPCAGLYSMVSFAVVPTDAPDQAFYSTLAPIGERWQPDSLAISGFTREQQLAFEPADRVMARFQAWATSQLAPDQRAQLVSDNPGFDLGFLTYYCEWAGFANPFGHSCRRIGDLFAGWKGNVRATRDWQRWKRTPHTHCALDDAKGVAEAWLVLLDRITTRR
jgi:hypothetical protein